MCVCEPPKSRNYCKVNKINKLHLRCKENGSHRSTRPPFNKSDQRVVTDQIRAMSGDNLDEMEGPVYITPPEMNQNQTSLPPLIASTKLTVILYYKCFCT